MESDLYISRVLFSGDKTYQEDDLISKFKLIVILAEPGAGKTELLKSLARKQGVNRVSASIFRADDSFQGKALVIDAVDEVAKVDQLAVDTIVVKAKQANAERVILSSRASEWSEARSKFVKECFGEEPKVLNLEPFNQDEQKALFENHLPGEKFTDFINEVCKFDLQPLLGNPQFLNMFADAYIQGGRVFTGKKKIFDDR